jgi:AraC family transcriptional regulator
MDDERIACEHSGITVRMMGDNLLCGMHQTEKQDQRLTSKLLTVVSELIETMAEALSEDREAARECVRNASAALLSCARGADESPDETFGGPSTRTTFRGGLAPWQVRSLTAYIDANLNTSLSCETLARLARLSVAHFSREFKYTFGYSPHVFVMRRRMERAQGLMLKSNAPLAQIALECGLADQAHLSRLFLQFAGQSPAAWRRARLTEAGDTPLVRSSRA